MTDLRRIIREAFLLGFMVSREGFNAECPYDHLAPSGLHNPRGWTESEWREMVLNTEEFITLRNEAVKQIQGQCID